MPLVYFSASSLNFSAPLPFGVSLATTWLNLMMMGSALAGPARPSASAAMDAAIAKVRMMSPLLFSLGPPRAGANPRAGGIISDCETEPLLAVRRAAIHDDRRTPRYAPSPACGRGLGSGFFF